MPIIGATELQPVNILGQYVQGMEAGRAAKAGRMQEASNALLMQAMQGGASEDELMRMPGGAAIVEQLAKARKERAGASTADIERRIKAADFVAQSAGSFLSNPASLSKDRLAPWVSELAQGGLLSPKAVASFEQMPDDPAVLAQGLQALQRAGLDIKSQLEQQFTSQDLGGSVRVIATPKYGEGSARVVPGSDAAVTRSPNAPVAPVLPGSNKFAETLATGAAKSLDTLRTSAESAARSIQTTKQLRPLLNDPKFISGTWANARLAISRALGQDVSATEAYFSGIAGEVAERIKAFGAGTGLSDSDRKFAQAWAGGNPDLTAKGIKRILEINEKSSRNTIDAYNKERDRLSTTVDPVTSQYYPEIAHPDAPAVGTVSKGYRFKGGDPRNEANWEKVK